MTLTKYTTTGTVYTEGRDAIGINGPYYLATDVETRIEELEQELKQFKGIFGDYDESSRTIEQAQIIWNMLKTQCADAQAEIEDWRSKLQKALTP